MAETSIIKAGGMLDVKTGKLRGPVSIVIEDGLIQSIDPSTLPADATVIELGDKVLLPGLMDMHTHLTLDFFTGDDWVTMPVLETAPDWAIRGVVFANLTLQAGFTTVRDVGANAGFPDVALMRAINRGMVPGPRMWPAGHYISITGGGGDINFFSPEQELIADGLIVDGVDEVRRAVREEIKYGGDWIKLMVTGAFMSAGDNPQNVHFSPEELEVAVAELEAVFAGQNEKNYRDNPELQDIIQRILAQS